MTVEKKFINSKYSSYEMRESEKDQIKKSLLKIFYLLFNFISLH